jgi:hypothetical protein
VSVPDDVLKTGREFLLSVWPDQPSLPELAFLSQRDVAELRARQCLVLFEAYVTAALEWLGGEAERDAL